MLIILLSGWSVFAQKQGERESLRDILPLLSTRYGVTFNYADETIKDILVVPPAENLLLTEALEVLQQATDLNFLQLSDQFISITKNLPELFNICEYIKDGENNKPIFGATIRNKEKVSISDESGFFKLTEMSAQDSILIHSLGFENKILAVDVFPKDPCIDILLKPKVTKLQEIVITNFIINGIDISSDGAIRIDAKTQGILPGLSDPDVLQTIQALPGIQSINETVSDINVRGGTNDQNLIFWDDIKMYQSGHFFGLISAFNPYITNDVTLIKNGTSTALSDGVSSTIDIQTDHEVDEEFSGGAGINMINADLFMKIPLADKISLQISGRRSISDLIQTPTYQRYFSRIFRNTAVTGDADPQVDSLLGSDEYFNFYDVTAKLLYDITPKDKLRISFLNIHNEITYEENAFVQNELETKTSGLEQSTLATGISYQRAWSEKLLTTARLYYSGYSLSAINYDIRKNQRLIQENEILDTGIKLDARIALNSHLDLLTGYQFFEVGNGNLEDINNPTYRRLIKRVLRTHAAFAECNYSSLSGLTNLRLGLRANYFEKFNRTIVEPRLAFNQRFLSYFSFELLGEMKSQTTTQVVDLQNDFLGVEKRRWVLANEEDIPIVTSEQLSAGLRFQKGNFLASINGYWKLVEGITSSSQGFQIQFQYVRSSGSYEVQGLDFLINQKFGSLTSWLSYSYADNQYEFPEFIPSVFPNNLDIRHTITLGTSYQIKNFQLSGGVNWRTGKPYTVGTGVSNFAIEYETPNSSRLDQYLRVDLSAKYRWQFSSGIRGEIGASVWNVLDNNNIVNVFYQIDESGNLQTIKQSALGFTPNLVFRVDF